MIGFDNQRLQDNMKATAQNSEKKLERAEEFAKEKHARIIRKDKITPYTFHLEQVVAKARMLGIQDEVILCAAWLHDTIEDTNTDFDEIADKQGFGFEVATIVAQVSKDKRLPEAQRESLYVEQLAKANWKAQVIKLCDIWANIEDLPSGYPDKEKRLIQIKKKISYFKAIRNGLEGLTLTKVLNL